MLGGSLPDHGIDVLGRHAIAGPDAAYRAWGDNVAFTQVAHEIQRTTKLHVRHFARLQG